MKLGTSIKIISIKFTSLSLTPIKLISLKLIPINLGGIYLLLVWQRRCLVTLWRLVTVFAMMAVAVLRDKHSTL